jgi:hypothetical protein
MPHQTDEEKALELYNRREAGILPDIDILGIRFLVDMRRKELREYNAPWNIIDLRNLESTTSGEAYLCIFDKEEHVGYHTADTIIAEPENLVLLEIPHEIILDPYAIAREHGINTAEFVRQNPIKADLKALVRPLPNELSITKPENEHTNLREAQAPDEDYGKEKGRRPGR